MFIFNSYWIGRLLKKNREKGILGLLKSLISFIDKVLNPKHTGEFPLKHFFLKKRKLIKKFTKENLDQLDDQKIINVGNYLIKENILNSKSIIYSFGIGENLGFEKKIADTFKCSVYCFDPTSLAKNFMEKEKYNKTSIIFQPYGIWNVDGKIKFFYQDENNLNNSGGSITNLFETNKYDLLECFKLSTLMKKNNHNKVDVVKLDIEGASIEVIHNFMNENINPNQIVVEFEYSETDEIDESEFEIWSKRLKEIISLMKTKNYKCYNLPRYSHLPYSTIEILFVKRDF
jgi:FkbM family methyltransferase